MTLAEIHDIILEAFDYQSFKRALMYGGYDLEEITLGQDFNAVVADVVEYFYRENSITHLIKLLQDNSENPKIKNLVWTYLEKMSDRRNVDSLQEVLEQLKSILLVLKGLDNNNGVLGFSKEAVQLLKDNREYFSNRTFDKTTQMAFNFVHLLIGVTEIILLFYILSALSS